MARRERFRIELYAELATKATDDIRFRDIGDLLDLILQFRDDAAQRRMVEGSAVKSQGKNGDIVNRARFEERKRDVRRNLVEVRLELLVELDQALFNVLAYQIADNDQSFLGSRDRIDVLHAFDLGDFTFERFSQLFFDNLGGSPGEG